MANHVESPVTILIVEDDAPARETLAILLRHCGYAVAEAAHGREALDLLHTAGGLPELILLDLMMPVMDGWQFHRALQREPAWSALPVVLCTGAGDAELHADALSVAGWVNKPIDPDELFALLHRVLGSGP